MSEDKKVQALKDNGVIMVAGSLDDEKAAKICSEILEMNLNKKLSEIKLIINSPGGNCDSGFSVVELMRFSSLPVKTVGLGLISSMSLIIFMAGEKGHRVITENTMILSHRFWTVNFGSHAQLIAARKMEDMLHENFVKHYQRYSNLETKEEIERRLLKETDVWLLPSEAIGFGLADEIVNKFKVVKGE